MEQSRLEHATQVYERQELPRMFVHRQPADVEGVVGVVPFVVVPYETLNPEVAERRRTPAIPRADARERNEARLRFARDCPDELAETDECLQHPYMRQLAEREAAAIDEVLRPGGLARGLTLAEAGIQVRADAWLTPSDDR
jgi:hypothetical protein